MNEKSLPDNCYTNIYIHISLFYISINPFIYQFTIVSEMVVIGRVSVNSQIAPRGRVGLSADLDRKSFLVAFGQVALVWMHLKFIHLFISVLIHQYNMNIVYRIDLNLNSFVICTELHSYNISISNTTIGPFTVRYKELNSPIHCCIILNSWLLSLHVHQKMLAF